MPHIALYRKYRPKTFTGVIGQPHIVKALRNQIIHENVGHAYLFCGTRGTGKTSAAKIFSRAINCKNPKEGDPCNECEICLDILADRLMDSVEIDAASNNGVDDVRKLREEVKFLPTMAEYKTYIIDEVHMLSGSAFNALLKTLEEPPAHVKFILATTDPQKIPATILSRCQRYDFKRINLNDMTKTLASYLEEEKVTFEQDALDYIAYHSDGAMRDALSLLDQCMALDNHLSLSSVRDMIGSVDRDVLFDFTTALLAGNSKGVVDIIENAMGQGRDVMQLTADIVRHLRDVLVVSLTDSNDFTEDLSTKLKKQSSGITTERLLQTIYMFSELIRELRLVPHPRTAFEVCSLKACIGVSEVVYNEAAPKKEAVATKTEMKVKQEQPPVKTEQVVSPPLKTEQAVSPPVEKASDDIPVLGEPSAAAVSSGQADYVAQNWQTMIKSLKYPLRSYLLKCTAHAANDILYINCNEDMTIRLLRGKEAEVINAIKAFTNSEKAPSITIGAENEPTKPQESKTDDFDDWAAYGRTLESGEMF